jgi:hypothetical protein
VAVAPDAVTVTAMVLTPTSTRRSGEETFVATTTDSCAVAMVMTAPASLDTATACVTPVPFSVTLHPSDHCRFPGPLSDPWPPKSL